LSNICLHDKHIVEITQKMSIDFFISNKFK
jgi:hypothetical protein